MSTQTRAYITPQIVRWARERARQTPSRLAEKLNTNPERVMSWEEGDERPTLRQAQQLARTLRIPFGYLFLSSPPGEELPIPDLRTVRDAGLDERPSPEFVALLNDVTVKQQWYREFIAEEGRPLLDFVGKFTTRDDPHEIAADITTRLEMGTELRGAVASWEEFLRRIIQNAERIGVLVMRSGVAAGNPHCKLSVSEFRGFAISDNLAPLIFLNAADSKAGQIFTFAHEIAHVWIGASGISNEPVVLPNATSPDVERFCNQVAAEALVPYRDFLNRWISTRTIDENLKAAVRHYRVSSLVVLRRALDLRTINLDQYRKYAEQESLKHRVLRGEDEESGGNFFATLMSRNSPTFTRTVVSGALDGKVLLRDAARLLNVKVPTIHKVAARLSEGA